MKKAIPFLIAMLSLTLFSCNTQSKNDDEQEKAASTTVENPAEEAHHEHDSDEAIAAIELNNGEKWAVNNEMKPYVSAGSDLVEGFLKSSGSDYSNLAKQLKQENDKLIKSCTMEGKSHDELHKWLHPHLELVEELKNEKDSSKRKEMVEHLKESYKTYSQYFQ